MMINRRQGDEAVRLLKFVAIFATGGTERQFVNLALSLEGSRFRVHFGCLRRWGQLLEEIDGRGIPIFERRGCFEWSSGRGACRRYGHDLQTLLRFLSLRQWRLARDIRRHGIQIVHTYGFYANVFAIPAARLAGARIVASIRDLGVYLSPRQRLLQRIVCRFADRIVVNANAIKDWLVADGCPADRIIVIPNGLDFERFRPVERTGTLHKEVGLPAGAPLVGVVGRLAPRKGLEDFLSAAAVVASRFPSARFLIVGAVETGHPQSADPLRLAQHLVYLQRGLICLFETPRVRNFVVVAPLHQDRTRSDHRYEEIAVDGQTVLASGEEAQTRGNRKCYHILSWRSRQ